MNFILILILIGHYLKRWKAMLVQSKVILLPYLKWKILATERNLKTKWYVTDMWTIIFTSQGFLYEKLIVNPKLGKSGEPVTNKIMLYKSITNTELIHFNICFWYLWYLTTNLMRLISVNQSWTTRMMWHTDMRNAAWCKDCNNNKNTVKLKEDISNIDISNKKYS